MRNIFLRLRWEGDTRTLHQSLFFHGALGHVLKCTIVLTTSPIDVAFWWLFAYNFNKLKPKIAYGSSP